MIAAATPPVWCPRPSRDPARALALADALGAPAVLGEVLVRRGHGDLDSARRLLHPSPAPLHDPGGLAGLAAAVERLDLAAGRGERVLVQGDYDVDGITSTFVMLSGLRRIGLDPLWRLPHRVRDGYGLTVAAIEEAARLGATVVVTVDCGISAVAAVARARELGVDVVVTDHHVPGPALPPACAIVNPRRPDCGYPFKSLAGVGVTFKVVTALLAARGHGLEACEDLLDVVALGTVADVVPLVGENRVLASRGLERLGRTERPGLRALIEATGLAGRRITAGQVAFTLAPRLNAAGRMGSADQALRLLLARDDNDARACAASLEADNTRRRALDDAAVREASERVEHELGWPDRSSLVLWSERWHPGVLGIVAARLLERFQRPSVLIAVDGEKGRGSGRSAFGLDLNQVLDGCSDLLETWGGHAHAAGLTVRRERLPALRERIESLVSERLDREACVSRLWIDADVTLGACDLDLAAWLARLAPFGLENPEPVLRVADAAVESVERVGGDRHLKLRVRDASGTAEAIGFGLGDRAGAFARGGRCALAFHVGRDTWMGGERVQLRLRDARPL